MLILTYFSENDTTETKISLKKVKLTKLYTKEQLMMAIESVNSGILMANEASKIYGVPVSTIHVKAKEARQTNQTSSPGEILVQPLKKVCDQKLILYSHEYLFRECTIRIRVIFLSDLLPLGDYKVFYYQSSEG